MKIVVDASIAAKWFVKADFSTESRALLSRFHTGEFDFIAPDVLKAETANALRHYMSFGTLTRPLARAAVADFLRIPVEYVRFQDLLDEAIELAFRYNGGVMDALYVALAVRNDGHFVTADKGAVNAFAPLKCVSHIHDFSQRLRTTR